MSDERTMTQRIEEHNQAEYVRGIQAGRRIERQCHLALRVRDIVLYFAFGFGCGWLLL